MAARFRSAWQPSAAEAGLIDSGDVIRRHTLQEHIAKADEYFAGLSTASPITRKPYHSAPEAADILACVAALLHGLDLHAGMRVLDFGGGFGWLGRMLATMGCEVTVTDVSAHAMRLGAELAAADPLLRGAPPMRFIPYDGLRLPGEDGAYERIIAFDCLHHVTDFPAVFREFGRTLSDGGLLGFSEPGPNHSRTAAAQAEMRNYGVVERDFVVEDIWQIAQDAGFTRLRLALFTPQPWLVGLRRFNWAMRVPKPVNFRGPFLNRRIGVMRKGAPVPRDSRAGTDLECAITLSLREEDGRIRGTGTARNTGKATWLPSGPMPGAVQVGVHLFDGAGQMADLNHARIHLSDVPVPQGGSATFTVDLARPDLPEYSLVFDLVAEEVAWFDMTIGRKRDSRSSTAAFSPASLNPGAAPPAR